MTKGYLSGQMSGQPDFNYPAFEAAAEDLRKRGWTIVSPHELDKPEEIEGVEPDEVPEDLWQRFLARDLRVLVGASVTHIICLPGWEKSRGAQLEVHVARQLGKKIVSYPDLTPLDTEERIIDPTTGGAKGRKAERYDLIPWGTVDELARVYGHGAQKYEDFNWARGYGWRLSLGALFRHVTAFAQGEDRDPESGLHHLAHAMWHCATLQTFQRFGLGTDDRYKPEEV